MAEIDEREIALSLTLKALESNVISGRNYTDTEDYAETIGNVYKTIYRQVILAGTEMLQEFSNQ